MVSWRFTLVGLFSAVAIVAIACAALANPSPTWTTVVVSATFALLSFAVLAAIFRRGARRAFWIGFATIGCGYTYFIAHDKLAFAPFDDAGPPLATTKLLVYLGDKLYGNVGHGGYGYAPGGYPAPYQTAPISVVPYEVDVALENPGTTPTGGDSDRHSNFPASTPSDANPESGNGDPAPDETVPVAYGVANPPASGPYGTTMYVPSFDPLRGQRFLRIGQYLSAVLLGMFGGLIARWMYASGERIAVQSPTARDG